jgi:hypothetical protein
MAAVRVGAYSRFAATRKPTLPVDDAGSVAWRAETRYLRQ